MNNDAAVPIGRRAALTLPPLSLLPLTAPGFDPASGLIGGDAQDMQSRPFSLLRSQLVKVVQATGQRLIGVTSASPGAGKSYIASNLALALARMPEQPVYLFDFDFRRPALAQRFGVDGATGVAAYLDGTHDDLAGLGTRIEHTELALFAALADVTDPAALLSGTRFAALVDAMHRLPPKAIVICDLPPVFVSDDAIAVIAALGAYLHVIEDTLTPVGQVEEAKRLLDPAQCIGVVLNRYAGKAGDSYGYDAVQRYKRYYHDAASVRPKWWQPWRFIAGRRGR